MKSSNGFTLVELLAVMILLGLLMVLTIPAYTSVYSGIKRNNYQNKLVELSNAAKKYGNKIKDEVKNEGDACYRMELRELIEKGYLPSDLEGSAAFVDPTDQSRMEGEMRICYCKSDYDIEAYYVEEFSTSRLYYVGDIVSVTSNGVTTLYECKVDYKIGKSITAENDLGQKYFQKLSC